MIVFYIISLFTIFVVLMLDYFYNYIIHIHIYIYYWLIFWVGFIAYCIQGYKFSSVVLCAVPLIFIFLFLLFYLNFFFYFKFYNVVYYLKIFLIEL